MGIEYSETAEGWTHRVERHWLDSYPQHAENTLLSHRVQMLWPTLVCSDLNDSIQSVPKPVAVQSRSTMETADETQVYRCDCDAHVQARASISKI